MKNYPNLWLRKWLKWTIIDGIKKIRPLYYVTFKKEKVKEFLTKELDWKWYGGHHMENRSSYFLNTVFMRDG